MQAGECGQAHLHVQAELVLPLNCVQPQVFQRIPALPPSLGCSGHGRAPRLLCPRAWPWQRPWSRGGGSTLFPCRLACGVPGGAPAWERIMAPGSGRNLGVGGQEVLVLLPQLLGLLLQHPHAGLQLLLGLPRTRPLLTRPCLALQESNLPRPGATARTKPMGCLKAYALPRSHCQVLRDLVAALHILVRIPGLLAPLLILMHGARSDLERGLVAVCSCQLFLCQQLVALQLRR